ncbi:hypothetical protein GCM10011571_03980 [Marinithermofilum abyssi]|uniref:Uncharacterized protein n=1 Tax=Marinithermofilum abyssi TaxID=1571185 RepID=A0A8J2VH74_9BACL|nr:hypothetical protein [Marinithermofilum abyssi]GGE06063.1 hypothetical protein GCM10011571_03980 [Marinithermofilum abyssi]
MTKAGKQFDFIIISNGPDGKDIARQIQQSGKSAWVLHLEPGTTASVLCSSPIVRNRPGHQVEEWSQEDTAPSSRGVLTQCLSQEGHHAVYLLQAPMTEAPVNTGPYLTASDSGTVRSKKLPPFLLEREIQQRKRLIHRPHLLDRTVKTEETQTKPGVEEGKAAQDQPIFRERELKLRKRLTRGLRRTQVTPAASTASSSAFNPPVTEPPLPPIQEDETALWSMNETVDSLDSPEATTSFSLDETEWLGAEAAPGMGMDPETPKEESLPTEGEATAPADPETPDRTQEDEEQPVYPKSVIPMNHGRVRNRRSPRKKDRRPFQSYKEEETREFRESTSIPGHRVWEAPEKGEQQEEVREDTDFSFEYDEEAWLKSFQRKNSPRDDREADSATSENRKSATPPDTPPASKERTARPFSKPPASSAGRPKKPTRSSRPFEQVNAARKHSDQRPSARKSASFMGEEEARRILKQSSSGDSGDTLKRDTIELEDPYGYDSYEDFLTPFANAEVEKLEKRKLALRGLHNLINNLG